MYVRILIKDGEDEVSVSEYCRRKGYNIASVLHYKYKHPELSYQEVFEHFEFSKNKQRVSRTVDKYIKLYNAWKHMLDRCEDVNDKNYHNYGGRGIKVCNRWHIFANFYEDLYESCKLHCEQYGDKNTTLDRVDVNGNYEPSNCRWATWKEQAKNQRKTLRLDTGEPLVDILDDIQISYSKARKKCKEGATKKDIIKETAQKRLKTPSGEYLTDYCRRHNISYDTISYRLYLGWSLEKALKEPIHKEKSH